MVAEPPWSSQEHLAEERVGQTKYLHFYRMQRTPGGKTNRYVILSRSHDQIIAWVRWYGAWRQYCFSPSDGTVWNTTCLVNVQTFLEEINTEHRNAKR